MSIAKVAEKAGVSQATVSYVMNGKPGVSAATIERVNQAIAELGYVPRAKTRPPVKMKNIALVFPDGAMSQSPLNTQLFDAAHRQLDRRGFGLVPVRLTSGANLNDMLASNAALANVDGVILFYYQSTVAIRAPLSVPVVTVLGHPDPILPLICDHVEPDNTRIGAMAARHLAGAGHREIIVIKPSTKVHPAMDQRESAFLVAARSLGVNARARHIPLELALSGAPGHLMSDHPLAKWLAEYKTTKNPPTGVFVPSDPHLAIVFNAMSRVGIEPGVDVDFIGCNNESVLLQGLSPTPATIDLNTEQMARSAIHVLLQRIGEADDRGETCSSMLVEPILVA